MQRLQLLEWARSQGKPLSKHGLEADVITVICLMAYARACDPSNQSVYWHTLLGCCELPGLQEVMPRCTLIMFMTITPWFDTTLLFVLLSECTIGC